VSVLRSNEANARLSHVWGMSVSLRDARNPATGFTGTEPCLLAPLPRYVSVSTREGVLLRRALAKRRTRPTCCPTTCDAHGRSKSNPAFTVHASINPNTHPPPPSPRNQREAEDRHLQYMDENYKLTPLWVFISLAVLSFV
jgi:hypothetical protein